MAALRKGHCYTPLDRPYSRKSKVRSKGYIKAIPPKKLAKFVMGDNAGQISGKYPYTLSLIMLEPIQLRDNAIESGRQHALRNLDEKLKGNFYFTVPAYPHQILREHKMLTGAGADRMQTGMAHSFGKPGGVAARIKANGRVFCISCVKEAVPIVRGILEEVRPKLPGKKSIITEIKK
jgi:large subunit ribosomal protein L10e